MLLFQEAIGYRLKSLASTTPPLCKVTVATCGQKGVPLYNALRICAMRNLGLYAQAPLIEWAIRIVIATCRKDCD